MLPPQKGLHWPAESRRGRQAPPALPPEGQKALLAGKGQGAYRMPSHAGGKFPLRAMPLEGFPMQGGPAWLLAPMIRELEGSAQF